MNKTPVKQIYLLSVIVFGIITLSVYSTYAIFTLESETSDIVNLETSNVLNINETTYEYKQVKVEANTSISTDIDIYNNFDYDICYSVWYKVVPTTGINTNVVSVYQNTSEGLTTSGSLDPVTSRRTNITIKNNNDKMAKVNVGVTYFKNEGTCELNISNDKRLITSTMDETKLLSDMIIKDIEIKNNKTNYITYSDKTEELVLNTYGNIQVATKYTYQDESFKLEEPIEIQVRDIINYVSNDNQKYYTCIDGSECRHLYRINEVEKENNTYKITKYDLMVGYLSGESGVRKVNQNYYYYGDNPNNFIYFNCSNELDNNSCELWRIIGAFYSQEDNKYITKIIKNSSVGLTNYGNNNTWKDSLVISKLKDYKLYNENMIKEMNYKTENITNLNININQIPLLNDSYKSNIMIMNLSDYLNTSICKDKKINEFDNNCLNNNWLNNNYLDEEWTMTIKYEESYLNELNETIIPENNKVYSIGSNIKESLTSSSLNIRPVVYLKNTTILLDGDGSFEKPYIVR